ncbi:hypothetical protein T484DRAFT_3018579 [Baffinella frigidus]|nr:hypothetical protein T484DRAFT_3018579 [Cryptophyta sp. CCMP2293]
MLSHSFILTLFSPPGAATAGELAQKRGRPSQAPPGARKDAARQAEAGGESERLGRGPRGEGLLQHRPRPGVGRRGEAAPSPPDPNPPQERRAEGGDVQDQGEEPVESRDAASPRNRPRVTA